MTNEEAAAQCRAFVREHDHAVLATAAPDGQPHAATVAYLCDDSLTFYVMTRRQTRKVQHIEANPKVALVVGVGPEGNSMQAEGTAELLPLPESTEIMERFLVEKDSAYKVLLKMQGLDFVTLKITTTWIRWFSINPADPGETYYQIR